MNKYTLGQLAEKTGVTPRTLRHWISRGVLPPPDGMGRYAGYGYIHEKRIKEIQQLQAEGLSLDEIKHRIRADVPTIR